MNRTVGAGRPAGLSVWLVSTVVVPVVIAVIPVLGSYYDATGTAAVVLFLFAAVASMVGLVWKSGLFFRDRGLRRSLLNRKVQGERRADTLVMAVSPHTPVAKELLRVNSRADLANNTVWLGTPLYSLVERATKARQVGLLVSTKSQKAAEAYEHALKLWDADATTERVSIDSNKENEPEHLKERLDALLSRMGVVDGGGEVVVDVTGGTKPMSIALYDKAVEHGFPVSYVESDQKNGGPDPTSSRIRWWNVRADG